VASHGASPCPNCFLAMRSRLPPLFGHQRIAWRGSSAVSAGSSIPGVSAVGRRRHSDIRKDSSKVRQLPQAPVRMRFLPFDIVSVTSSNNPPNVLRQPRIVFSGPHSFMRFVRTNVRPNWQDVLRTATSASIAPVCRSPRRP
jgi:hypothetical protein